MDKRLGVFICSGCSIGESLDVGRLEMTVGGVADVVVCRSDPFLCADESQTKIRNDIARASVNAIVVAACSPRVKMESFNFGPGVIIERVNLREQVVWSHPPLEDSTQLLAEDLLRMGVAKAEKMECPDIESNAISRTTLAAGIAALPRNGDFSLPAFSLNGCTRCKQCAVECPYGAIDEDEKRTPKINPYRCRRCGICIGSCPERLISFRNYSGDMIAEMVKAIEIPEHPEDEQRILIFACESDAYPAIDQAGMSRLTYGTNVRIIPLRCLSSMNPAWIGDAFSRGIDGVLLMGCKPRLDYQCPFVRGSELANRRLANVKDILERMQLEAERIEVVELAIDECDRVPEVIDGFILRIRDVGPNAYKWF